MAKSFSGTRIITKTQEAAHDVLKQSRGLLLDELGNHIAQHSPDSVESFIGGADIVETVVVEQNLLDDEDGYSLAKLGSGLHNAETQRNNFGCE